MYEIQISFKKIRKQIISCDIVNLVYLFSPFWLVEVLNGW